MNQTSPAYPIGRFEAPALIDADLRSTFIEQMASAPVLLRRAVDGLTERQLDTPYREGGWTVRQVVHHLPDSHLNAYVRFKLALTQTQPTIIPYDEAHWAELPDAKTGPIDFSLALLESLHRRWIACIRAVRPAAFERTFNHPELGIVSLDQQLAMYAWHGRHHVAHITSLRGRMGWV